jgi:hypothetical protein
MSLPLPYILPTFTTTLPISPSPSSIIYNMPAAMAPAPANIPAKDGMWVGFAAALEPEPEAVDDAGLLLLLAALPAAPPAADEDWDRTLEILLDALDEMEDWAADALAVLAPETAELDESWDMPACEELLLWAAAMATRERMARENFIFEMAVGNNRISW